MSNRVIIVELYISTLCHKKVWLGPVHLHFTEVSVLPAAELVALQQHATEIFWASLCTFRLTQQMQHKSHTSQLWYSKSKTQRINSVV